VTETSFFSAKHLSSNVKTASLTRAPENIGENHDISFEAPFTLRLTAVGGVQGVQAHPQNFWFGENPGKICGNLGKMCEYLHKLAVYALIFQKMQTFFLLEVMFSFSSFRTS